MKFLKKERKNGKQNLKWLKNGRQQQKIIKTNEFKGKKTKKNERLNQAIKLSKNKWLLEKEEKKKKANRDKFWKRLLNQTRREKKPKNKNDKNNFENKNIRFKLN